MHIFGRETLPVYPLDSLTPGSTCPHTRATRLPYPQYCEVCSRSWADGRRELIIGPDDEQPPKKYNPDKPNTAMTRREKRALMQGTA